MIRKSLYNPSDLSEIQRRILQLQSHSQARWGSMDAAQMLAHCTSILQVATGETTLPEVSFPIKIIGIASKKIMWTANTGIPRNMPTFENVKITTVRNFNEEKERLQASFLKFIRQPTEDLPHDHSLFGKMSRADWGFLEYKHIHHHLKQFGV